MSAALARSASTGPSSIDRSGQSVWTDALSGAAGTEEPRVDAPWSDYFPDGTAEPSRPAVASRPVVAPTASTPVSPRLVNPTAPRPASTPTVWRPAAPAPNRAFPTLSPAWAPPRSSARSAAPGRSSPVGAAPTRTQPIAPNRMPPPTPGPRTPARTANRSAATQAPNPSARRGARSRNSRAASVVSVLFLLLVVLLASNWGRQLVDLIERAVHR